MSETVESSKRVSVAVVKCTSVTVPVHIGFGHEPAGASDVIDGWQVRLPRPAEIVDAWAARFRAPEPVALVGYRVPDGYQPDIGVREPSAAPVEITSRFDWADAGIGAGIASAPCSSPAARRSQCGPAGEWLTRSAVMR